MKFGRIFVLGVVCSPSFREWARTPGSLNEEMGLRVAFMIVWRRMIVFRANRFNLRFRGDEIPSILLEGTWLPGFVLAPTQPTCVFGGMTMRARCLLRIPRRRGSLLNGESCA